MSKQNVHWKKFVEKKRKRGRRRKHDGMFLLLKKWKGETEEKHRIFFKKRDSKKLKQLKKINGFVLFFCKKNVKGENKKRAVVKSKRISKKEIHSKRTIKEEKKGKTDVQEREQKMENVQKTQDYKNKNGYLFFGWKKTENKGKHAKTEKMWKCQQKCKKIKKKFFRKKIQKFQAPVIKRWFRQRKQ